MVKLKRKSLSGYVLFLLGMLAIQPVVVFASDPLVMGIFPRRNATQTFKMFRPLAEHLSRQLGRPVKLVTTKNFPTFWKGVAQNKYDIVHYNQLHYIESHEKLGYKVLLSNVEFGQSKISGAFAVRKDSAINTVEDLKGKSILFGGGKKAMIAYVMNVVTLHRAGLSPGDYKTLFAKNPPNATIAVFKNRAAAAGIGDVGIKIPILKKKGVKLNELKLIGVSKPLPHLPWAVKKSISNELSAKIQTTMHDLTKTSAGIAILKKAGLQGLNIVSDSDYDVVRSIIKEFKKIK